MRASRGMIASSEGSSRSISPTVGYGRLCATSGVAQSIDVATKNRNVSVRMRPNVRRKGWIGERWTKGLALLACAISFGSAKIHAQGLERTFALIDSAEHAGKEAEAARLLTHMYTLTGFDPAALAAAALAAAQAGDNRLATAYFRQTVNEGFLDSAFLKRAQDTLIAVVRTPEWGAVIALAKQRLAAIDQPLRRELLDLALRDQAVREHIGEVMTRYGRNSPQGDSAARAMDLVDAPLLARLREIVALRGWPGRPLVADDGAHAAWLIIQHAPADVQRSLLPLIRSAITRGEGRLGDLALIEDRVLVAAGKPQLYGSQMRYSSTGGAPMLDSLVRPECVDLRRSAMGLDPLADYVRRFGATYDASSSKSCQVDSWSSDSNYGVRGARGIYGVRVTSGDSTLRIDTSTRFVALVEGRASVRSQGVTWRSTNPFVATVDSGGVVTAIAPGTTTIVATAIADESAMGAAMLTVTDGMAAVPAHQKP